jgi:hypothetical protein
MFLFEPRVGAQRQPWDHIYNWQPTLKGFDTWRTLSGFNEWFLFEPRVGAPPTTLGSYLQLATNPERV